MRCYNCGCELTEHKFCTNCGVDVVLYKKIIRTSNYFYNQGLERAKVRDLSGAIVSLHQSLKFNKNNIKARNLLGLVYFEMGEVAAALAEWVISKNFRAKKNMAVDYIDMVQSNTAKLDVFNQSIKKYNQALEYCKQPGGVDMAIIQLRRVTGQNPKLLCARQLLALCYISQGHYDSARRELEKCKSIDVGNTITLRYLAEVEAVLNPQDDGKKKDKNRDKEKNAAVITYTTPDNETIIQPNFMREHKGSATVLNIIFGIAIGLAIAYLLIIPNRVSQAKDEAQAMIKEIDTTLDAKNLTISELESTVSEQTAKIATLTESLNKYAGTEGTLLSMENLLKASAIYLNDPNNFLEVADYITEIDEKTWTSDTSENYKNLYYALKDAIGPNVCDAYYKEATSLYKGKEYDDAIAYLEAAIFFDAKDDAALYQLAVCYQAIDKYEDAKTVYNKVIEKFPASQYATKATQALKKMNQ